MDLNLIVRLQSSVLTTTTRLFLAISANYKNFRSLLSCVGKSALLCLISVSLNKFEFVS